MAGEGNPPVPAAQANVDSPTPADDQPTPSDEEALAAGMGVPGIDYPATSVNLGARSYLLMRERMKACRPAYDPGVSEAEYVASEVLITRVQMEQGLIKTNPGVNGKDRLDRTRAYATWRYRAFMNGEVASL